MKIDYWYWQWILHFYFCMHMLPSVRTFNCLKITSQKYLPCLSGQETKSLSFPLSVLYSLALYYFLFISDKLTIKRNDKLMFWMQEKFCKFFRFFVTTLINTKSAKNAWLVQTYCHSHTVVLCLICRHREIGNSSYMKVILTKNLTFFNIINHTKFQFAKMSGSLGSWHFLTPFLVHKRHRNSKNYIFFIVLDFFSNWNCVW